MNPDIIKRINDFTMTHKQKGKDSKAYSEIQSVMRCSLPAAKAIAAKSCNILSTYALLYGAGLISMTYAEWFKYLLDNGDIEKENIGWIKSRKRDIFKRLDLDIELIESKTVKGLPDGLYQIKIKNIHGTHFIAGYSIDGTLYVSDTSWRGTGIKAEEALRYDTLLWVNQYSYEV